MVNIWLYIILKPNHSKVTENTVFILCKYVFSHKIHLYGTTNLRRIKVYTFLIFVSLISELLALYESHTTFLKLSLPFNPVHFTDSYILYCFSFPILYFCLPVINYLTTIKLTWVLVHRQGKNDYGLNWCLMCNS